MPLSDKITLPDSSSVYVWTIEETEAELKQLFKEQVGLDDMLPELDVIRVVQKRKQWYAARIMSAECVKDFMGIYYDQFGAPHLVESDACVSYSHSQNKVAMIIHDECEVGIDIQKEDQKLKRIVTKFLNDEEMKHYEDSGKSLDHLHVLWSVKESIFKIHKHHLPFKDIKTGTVKNPEQGELSVKAERFDGPHKHKVHYHKLNGYYLAHSCYTD